MGRILSTQMAKYSRQDPHRFKAESLEKEKTSPYKPKPSQVAKDSTEDRSKAQMLTRTSRDQSEDLDRIKASLFHMIEQHNLVKKENGQLSKELEDLRENHESQQENLTALEELLDETMAEKDQVERVLQGAYKEKVKELLELERKYQVSQQMLASAQALLERWSTSYQSSGSSPSQLPSPIGTPPSSSSWPPVSTPPSAQPPQ